MIARRRDALEALRTRLPCEALAYPLDVSDAAALQNAATDFGTADLVIANAGISVGTSAVQSSDLEVMRRVFETNVLGLAATLGAFAPAMRTAGRGTLCGISSVAGIRGMPGSGAYSASKAAALTWLESLRVELHGSGVAVVTILPGYVDTPMTRVNPYRMPFLLQADDAAARIARAIDAKRRVAIIPWQMALVGRVLRILPPFLFDRLFARAPRKPRDLPL